MPPATRNMEYADEQIFSSYFCVEKLFSFQGMECWRNEACVADLFDFWPDIIYRLTVP